MSDFLLYPQHLAYCLADKQKMNEQIHIWGYSLGLSLTPGLKGSTGYTLFGYLLGSSFLPSPATKLNSQVEILNRTMMWTELCFFLSTQTGSLSSWHWPNWSCWLWSYHNETVSLQFSPKLDGARREIFSKLRCGQPHESNTYQAWGRTFLDTWG